MSRPSSASGQPPSLQELRASRGATPSPWRRFRRWIIAGGVAIFLILFGFFGLPPIIKAQAIKQLSARLGRQVSIEKVRFNPLVLSLTLENFAVAEADPAKGEFTGWSRLYVNFDSWSLFTGSIGFQEIALDGYRARVARAADASFNFDDLVARLTAADPAAAGAVEPAEKSAPSKPPAVAIRKLAVTDARVTFDDASRERPFSTVVGPLTFGLENFHTVGDPNAPYSFQAVTAAGEKLAWRGTVSADPVKSKGELRVENVDIARLSPYYHTLIAGELRSAFVDVSGRYEFELAAAGPVLRLSDGAFALRELRLGAPGVESDAFALRKLAVTGVSADATTLTAAIGKVSVEGVRVNAIRDAASIDLQRLLAPPPARSGSPAPAVSVAAPAAAVTSPAALPKVTLGELAVSDVQVTVADLTTPRRAEHRIENLVLSLRDLDSADLAKSLPLSLELTLPQQGKVSLSGSVAALPAAADLVVAVENVSFANASPYVEPFLNIRLADGVVRAAGRAVLRDGGVAFTGDLGVRGFRAVDGKIAQDFLRWGDFSVTGIRAGTAPLAFHADEIKFVEPAATIRVEADGSLNIAQAVAPGSEPGRVSVAAPAPAVKFDPAAASANSSASATLPPVSVGAFVFERAAFRFEDRSVQPASRGALTDFSGKIAGLSSEALGRADVRIEGKVDGVAPVLISGKVNPLGSPAFVDLVVDFKNIDLQPGAGPYVGKFVGRELARGSLSVAVKAKLDGRKIDTDNLVVFDQFFLGAKTNSPDATKLPVGLALALLRDVDGKISLPVPVKGSLDDPKFKIGRVVVQVFVNILTKAATSPFSLLGAAFGGGGDELGWQDFAAGATAPDEVGIKKLETVAKALNGRPALTLDLAAAYDAAADADALRAAAWQARVRAAVWEELRRTDPATPPPEQIEVTAERRLAAVARLFAEAFPPGPGEIVPVAVAETGEGSLAMSLGGAVAAAAPATAPETPAVGDEAAGSARRQVGRLPRYSDSTFAPPRKASSSVTPSAPDVPPAPSVDASAPAASAPVALAPGQQVAGVPTITLAEMERRLAAAIEIPETDLRALAEARAKGIRVWLLETGKVPAERVFLGPVSAGRARVNLNLQ